MNYTPEDVKLLAKCGWLEGRDGGPISMAAVMHVVMNRIAAPDFPNTVHDVIYQHNAFSFTRPDNPEYGQDPETSTGLDREMYNKALQLADLVLQGGDRSFVSNACYYEAAGATSGWFRRVISGPHLMGTPGHEFITEIAGQRYYK